MDETVKKDRTPKTQEQSFTDHALKRITDPEYVNELALGSEVFFINTRKDNEGNIVQLPFRRTITQITKEKNKRKFVLTDDTGGVLTATGSLILTDGYFDPAAMDQTIRKPAIKLEKIKEPKKLIDNQAVLEDLIATELIKIKDNIKKTNDPEMVKFWQEKENLLKDSPLEYFAKEKEKVQSKLEQINNNKKYSKKQKEEAGEVQKIIIKQLQRAMIALEAKEGAQYKITPNKKETKIPEIKESFLSKIEKKKEVAVKKLTGFFQEKIKNASEAWDKWEKEIKIGFGLALLGGMGGASYFSVTEALKNKQENAAKSEAIFQRLTDYAKQEETRLGEKYSKVQADLQKNQKTVSDELTKAREQGEFEQKITNHGFTIEKPKAAESSFATEIVFDHGQGAIEGIIELKQKISEAYGGDFSKMPEKIKNFMENPGATKQAIELGLFDPNAPDGKESALIKAGSILKFDEDGNLLLLEPHQSDGIPMVHSLVKYHGPMFSAKEKVEATQKKIIEKPVPEPMRAELLKAEIASQIEADSVKPEPEIVMNTESGEYKKDMKFLFDRITQPEWQKLKTRKAEEIMQLGSETDNTPLGRVKNFLHLLKTYSKLEPKENTRWFKFKNNSETVEEYVERAKTKIKEKKEWEQLLAILGN